MIQVETIPDTIQAAVLERSGNLRVQEIPQWPIEDYGDDDLMLIKVGACGVCGSDFRYFAGENPWAQHTLGKFMPNPPNIVLGHEYSGTVVAVLSEANRHWLGKRVAPICSKVCGECEDCTEGREHLCPNTVHMGHGQGWGDRDFYPGAYADYTLAWDSECFELAPQVTFEQAAMMDILAVGVHIARTGGILPGRPVLCIGAGPAGNAVAQAARAMGAGDIVLIDPSEAALDIARAQKLGTTQSSLEGLGQAFGTIFDTVGTPETLMSALNLLGKAGTLVNVAVHDQEITFNPMLLGSERRLVTSCNFRREDFETALRWLEDGTFRVDEWFCRVTLDELPARFEQEASGSGKGAFKLLITPQSAHAV